MATARSAATARLRSNPASTSRLRKKSYRKGDGWQSYAIAVRGDRAEVSLNGVVVSTADKLSTVPGFVGIQAEGTPLEFRNIRIHVFDDSSK